MFISEPGRRVSASQDNVFQNVNVSNTGQFNILYHERDAHGRRTGREGSALSITNSQFSNSGVNVIGDHITVQTRAPPLPNA